jgi:hypothetical protein
MKWAKASHIDTRFAQRHEVANDLLNLRRVGHGPDNVFADFRHKNKIYE